MEMAFELPYIYKLIKEKISIYVIYDNGFLLLYNYAINNEMTIPV